MKKHLCFVFIHKYKCLEDKSICLDNRYKFEFNPSMNVLTVRKNESYIDHLWGKGIYSLTAIVGENGAGKTTTIRYIMEMVVSGQNKKIDDGVYVVEQQGELQVYSTRAIKFDVVDLKIKQLRSNSFSIKTFYYSSHFSIPNGGEVITDSQWEGMYNGSDFYRLLNDYQNYCNIYTFDMQRTIQEHIIGYNCQNFYRIALLLTEQYEEMKDYGLKPPRYIFIAPNRSGQGLLQGKTNEVDDIEIPNIDLSSNIKLTGKKKALYMFVYHILLNMATIETRVDMDIISMLRSWIDMFKKETLEDGNFYELFEQLLDMFPKYIVRHISSLLSTLENICKLNEANDMLYVDMCDEKKRLEFKMLLGSTRKHLIFLTARYFDMFYAHDQNLNSSIGLTLLSSGEQEMLNLFSRIYDAVYPKKMHSADNIKIPQLLILDEAEIGYHPMWQKKYVNNLIRFLNLVTNAEDFFQVILTSHSPIILSDIPKSCTNYLAIDNKDIPKDETFGANIFDLYRNSFFIRDGLIGEFAWDKIDKINNFLKVNEEDPKGSVHPNNDIIKKLKEVKKIILSIGDERIRDYLMDRLSKFDSQYTIDYYERKIKELKSNSYHEQD